MLTFSDGLFALVALLHVYFMLLEMYFWEKPLGLKIFRQSREQAAVTAVLAKNQGLYNGFLAAGVAWGLTEGHSVYGMRVRIFFGICVVVAGIYGTLSTKSKGIIVIQALPALLAIALLVAAPSYHSP